MKSVFPERATDFEIEDILTGDFYYRAVKEAYPEFAIELVTKGDAKTCSAYEREFKSRFNVGFSKKRVAETLKKLLRDGQADEQSRQNLIRVFEALLAKLTINPKVPGV